MFSFSLCCFIAFIGGCAGLLSGLFGIGGGAILVPALYYGLCSFGYAESAMHIAVSTSVACIVVIGSVTARNHYKNGLVDFNLVKKFFPGILVGLFIGINLFNLFSGEILKVLFGCIQLVCGSYMFFRTNNTVLFQNLPNNLAISCFSCLNSCLSLLMGIGGGVQNTIFMTIFNVPFRQAVAVSACLGPIIALGSTIAIMLFSNNVPVALEGHNVGCINLELFLLITISSAIMSPLGVRLSCVLPVEKLKKYFSIFVLLLSCKMLGVF